MVYSRVFPNWRLVKAEVKKLSQALTARGPPQKRSIGRQGVISRQGHDHGPHPKSQKHGQSPDRSQ